MPSLPPWYTEEASRRGLHAIETPGGFVLVFSTLALAQDVDEITFTRLLVRDDGAGVFNPSEQAVRQLMLDELREHGLAVPVGDSVLFGTGVAAATSWQMGGTLMDLACVGERCEAAVEWQLFHVPSATVCYEATTRGSAQGADPLEGAVEAVRASFGAVLTRPMFQRVLTGEPLPEKFVDEPDPPGALVAAATAPEPEVETWGRAPSPRGQGQLVAGTIVGGLGAALVFISWNDYQLSYELTPGRFRRQQAVNTVGWAGLVAGTGLAVSGILRTQRPAPSTAEEAP
jgi:hypothetical protein